MARRFSRDYSEKIEREKAEVAPPVTRTPEKHEEDEFQTFSVLAPEVAALLKRLRLPLLAIGRRNLAYIKIRMAEGLTHVILDKDSGDVLLTKPITRESYSQPHDPDFMNLAQLFTLFAEAPEVVQRLLGVIDRLEWQRARSLALVDEAHAEIIKLRAELALWKPKEG